jgi:hypothetical protein
MDGRKSLRLASAMVLMSFTFVLALVGFYFFSFKRITNEDLFGLIRPGMSENEVQEILAPEMKSGFIVPWNANSRLRCQHAWVLVSISGRSLEVAGSELAQSSKHSLKLKGSDFAVWILFDPSGKVSIVFLWRLSKPEKTWRNW